MIVYTYDENTREFLHITATELDPLETELQGKEVWLLPANSTFEAPPGAKEKEVAVWENGAWVIKEDHRKKRDEGGAIIDESGTPFWLNGDTYETPARYMTEIGPLPDGVIFEQPEKPQELIEAEIQQEFSSAIQSYLDSKAQELNYDSCLSVCSYVDTGVARFDCEGAAFRQWRSAVWAKGYEILAQVQSGERGIPTTEELFSELPELVIEYTT